MRIKSILPRAALLAALVAAAACARGGLPPVERASARRLPLRLCRVRDVTEDLLCGSLEVFENRERRSGRKISLNVVVIPAQIPAPRPDPTFHLEGGPGIAATMAAGVYVNLLPGYRRDRDVVLVDQRGTGGSNPLTCDLSSDTPNPGGRLDEMYPPAAVAACRERLGPSADLTLYTTPIAMDDLDDVRAWLGYDRINLVGLSYGTRAALVYMRRHPDHVRSAVLMGVAPTNLKMPLHHASDAQRAMDLLFDDCAADLECHAAFPKVKEELVDLLDRLDREAARVRYTPPGSDRSIGLVIRREIFAEKLRVMLYEAGVARRLPLVIHRAFEGDFNPLLAVALGGAGGPPALAEGMYLSVTCPEDTRLIDADEAKRLTEGTYFGDYRVAQQTRACSLWPEAELPVGYAAPLVSDAPVLMISGYLDPVTPPAWAEEVLHHLPHGRNLVLRHGGHLPTDMSGGRCMDRMILSFLDRGSSEDLDTSCMKEMIPPPFALQP